MDSESKMIRNLTIQKFTHTGVPTGVQACFQSVTSKNKHAGRLKINKMNIRITGGRKREYEYSFGLLREL